MNIPTNQEEWATKSNPTGFFREGTIIEVTGMGIKAENGRFMVTGPFLFQPSGQSYHQWKRLNKKGQLLGESTNNHRGGNAQKIRRMLETGAMRIVGMASAEALAEVAQ